MSLTVMVITIAVLGVLMAVWPSCLVARRLNLFSARKRNEDAQPSQLETIYWLIVGKPAGPEMVKCEWDRASGQFCCREQSDMKILKVGICDGKKVAWRLAGGKTDVPHLLDTWSWREWKSPWGHQYQIRECWTTDIRIVIKLAFEAGCEYKSLTDLTRRTDREVP